MLFKSFVTVWFIQYISSNQVLSKILIKKNKHIRVKTLAPIKFEEKKFLANLKYLKLKRMSILINYKYYLARYKYYVYPVFVFNIIFHFIIIKTISRRSN